MSERNSDKQKSKGKPKMKATDKRNVKGLVLGINAVRGETMWRIRNNNSGAKKRTYSFKTYEEALIVYNQLADEIEREGKNFQLSPTEKGGVIMWRNFSDERIRQGKEVLTLEEAVQQFISWQKQQDNARPLAWDMFREFCAFKEEEARGKNNAAIAIKVTARQNNDIKKMLLPLEEGCTVDIFDTAENYKKLEENLCATVRGKDGGKPTKTTIQHYRRAFDVFMNWLAKKGIIKRNPIAELPRIQEEEPKKQVFEIEELKTILNFAHQKKPQDLAWLAIGSFCGARPDELCRLEWSDIDFDKAELKVAHHKAKTGTARYIPVPAVCLKWLECVKNAGARSSGYIVEGNTFERRQGAISRFHKALKKHIGIEWSKDELRHSCLTYLCAKEEDLAKVSYWAGNSVDVMNKHYRQLKSKTEGVAWFSLEPEL